MQQPIQLRILEREMTAAKAEATYKTAASTNVWGFKRKYINCNNTKSSKICNNKNNIIKDNDSCKINNSNDNGIMSTEAVSEDVICESISKDCAEPSKTSKHIKIINDSDGADVSSIELDSISMRHSISARKLLSHSGVLPVPQPLSGAILSSSTLQQLAAQRNAAAVSTTGVSGHFKVSGVADGSTTAAGFMTAPSTLEQYRLQLYNYALSVDNLRCPSYSTAAIMAAAAYASNGSVINGQHGPATINTSGATAAAVYYGSGGNVSYAQPGNQLTLPMALFPQRIFQPEEPKPQFSYIGLIAMAILNSTESKLVLSDIYQYILDNYPYFRTRGPGWRNSIRHNLSLNDCFIKSGRSANGKGHYWAVHPANMDDFRKGDFRRRKAQRKVRKHMGLSVDDMGTDSPSPPLLDFNSPPPHHVDHHLFAHVARHQRHPAEQLEAAAMAHKHTFGYMQRQQHQYQVPAQHSLQNVQTTALAHFQQQHQQQLQHQHRLRQQQHHNYIGQASFDSTAAAAVAATMVSSAFMAPLPLHQQKQQQSQPCTYKNDQYKSQQDNIQLQPKTIRYDLTNDSNSDVACEMASGDATSKCVAFINETTTTTTATAAANVIANLYSQTRKRQFDVASLLAPDIKVDIVDDMNQLSRGEDGVEGVTTTQHTVVTKVSLQHQQIATNRYHQQQSAYKHQQLLQSHCQMQHGQQLLLTLQQQQQQLEVEEQDEIDVVANDGDECHKVHMQTLQHDAILLHNDADIQNNDDEEAASAEIIGDNDTTYTDADADVDGEIGNITFASSNITTITNTLPCCSTDEHIETSNTSPIDLEVVRQPNEDVTATVATVIVNKVSPSTVYELHSSSVDSIQHDSLEGTLTAIPTESSSHVGGIVCKEQQEQHVQCLMQHLQQQQQCRATISISDTKSANRLNEVNSHFFGRYYDTYMAAAAARSINSLNLTLQHHEQRQQPVEQQQQHQPIAQEDNKQQQPELQLNNQCQQSPPH